MSPMEPISNSKPKFPYLSCEPFIKMSFFLNYFIAGLAATVATIIVNLSDKVKDIKCQIHLLQGKGNRVSRNIWGLFQVSGINPISGK